MAFLSWGVSIPMRNIGEYHPIQPLAPTHGGSSAPPRDIDMLRVTRLGSLDFSGRLGLSRFNWARSRSWQLDSLSVISVLWKSWNVGNSTEHIQFHPALLQKTNCIYLGEVFSGLTTSQDFTMETMAPPPPPKKHPEATHHTDAAAAWNFIVLGFGDAADALRSPFFVKFQQLLKAVEYSLWPLI